VMVSILMGYSCFVFIVIDLFAGATLCVSFSARAGLYG
jgi:hypothetical protein